MKNFELVIARGGLRAARAIKSYREVRRRRPDRTAVERERSALPPPGAVEALPARRDDRCPFAENATFYRDHASKCCSRRRPPPSMPASAATTASATSRPRAASASKPTFAVVGVGVVPNVDFLADSGLALDNGVVVNQRFETSAPGVYAAGDVANFYDPLYGRQRRIEHWSNANYQGPRSARSSPAEEVVRHRLVVLQRGLRHVPSTLTLTTVGSTLASYGDGAIGRARRRELELETCRSVAERLERSR